MLNLYQVIDYTKKLPFRIHNIRRAYIMDEFGDSKNVLDHWHWELEITYTYVGHAHHYIDGICYEANPGSLFIVNAESIHKVISDIEIPKDVDVVATVIQVNPEFMGQILDNFGSRYFIAEPAIQKRDYEKIMKSFCKYADRDSYQELERLSLLSTLFDLLSRLCGEFLYEKESIFPINSQKNLERLRGIMNYINDHYKESLLQREVAERFYFSKEYFSRFFRKNTGMTFKEYLMRVRVKSAREAVVRTDDSMLEIALESGFTDSRALIIAFRAVYGETPYQYRKKYASANLRNFKDN